MGKILSHLDTLVLLWSPWFVSRELVVACIPS